MELSQESIGKLSVSMQKEIDRLYNLRAELQNNCKHLSVTKTPFSDSDYGTKTKYYYNCKCNNCFMNWIEDQ